jgi:pilus assembly protein FimV
MSRVGEPLNTEIDVVSVQGNEGESLAARIAPPEVYRSAHVAPVPPVEALRAEIVRRPDGRPAVRVTSAAPVEKPLVNLLVELSWAGGTPVVRQYSFLLDTLDRKPPPVTFAPPAADTVAPKPTEPAPAPAAPGEAPRASAIPEAGGTYAVQPGDSLLKIAQSAKYDGVTFPQMVVAIHRANEDAFIGGDMSRLKSGRTLTIPGRDAVAAVNADEARQTLAALRGQPPETARGRPAPAEPGPTGDDLVARERALTESRERAAALEQTRDDLKRLIDAREREIAELERQVGKSAGKSQPIRKAAP